jgi:hypothetical protein
MLTPLVAPPLSGLANRQPCEATSPRWSWGPKTAAAPLGKSPNARGVASTPIVQVLCPLAPPLRQDSVLQIGRLRVPHHPTELLTL